MQESPAVSVILTSYNHERYLSEAIDSVLSQTYSNYELIVLDDASTDSSWSIINSYTDPRITKFRNEQNGYALESLNNTIKNVAKGEYIAIHHSDDIWEPDKLQEQVNYIRQNPECGAVFTRVRVIGESGEDFDIPDHFYSNVFNQENRSSSEWLRYFFDNGNCLCHPSVLIRKRCYEDIGLYNTRLWQLPDFDMWVRLCMRYEIWVLEKELVRFRVREREANVSGNKLENRSRIFFEFYSILKNYISGGIIHKLHDIFPSTKSYKKVGALNESEEEYYGKFVYAKTLIDEGPYVFSKFLGIQLLYDLLGDEVARNWVWKNYEFGYRDFASITAKYGVPNITVEQYESEIQYRDKELRRLSGIEEKLIANEQELERLSGVEEELRFRDQEVLRLSTVEGELRLMDQELGRLRKVEVKLSSALRKQESLEQARDFLTSELGTAALERNALDLERNALKSERDTLYDQLNSVYASRSWKITKPLRAIKALLSRR